MAHIGMSLESHSSDIQSYLNQEVDEWDQANLVVNSDSHLKVGKMLAYVAALLLFGSSVVCGRPNILFILTDDQDLHMESVEHMPYLEVITFSHFRLNKAD